MPDLRASQIRMCSRSSPADRQRIQAAGWMLADGVYRLGTSFTSDGIAFIQCGEYESAEEKR